MKRFILTPQEVQEFRVAHKEALNRTGGKTAFNAVILLALDKLLRNSRNFITR